MDFPTNQSWPLVAFRFAMVMVHVAMAIPVSGPALPLGGGSRSFNISPGRCANGDQACPTGIEDRQHRARGQPDRLMVAQQRMLVEQTSTGAWQTDDEARQWVA